MRLILIAFAMISWATVSVAHQLNVFAFVEDGTVIVETKFTNGRIPVSGEVRVLDGENASILTLPLEKDGTATRSPFLPNVWSVTLPKYSLRCPRALIHPSGDPASPRLPPCKRRT